MLLHAIASEVGVRASYIERLARSANHLYKVYSIPKRRSDQKRTIEQPSRELKFLQRWIVANVIQNVPIHQSAAAYAPGSNVKKHADKHVRNNYLLRLDIRNFFPSIKGTDIRQHLIHNQPYLHFIEDDADIELLVAVVTRNGGLVIGAPSSPALSNQIMFQFDSFLSSWCENSEVTYTRYADDLYLSTRQPHVLHTAQLKVGEFLNAVTYPRLSLNDSKTAHTSRKKKRLVTGLSLTSDGRVSLGRRKKREIRSLIHTYYTGTLAPERSAYLAGYLAYAHSVEPEFIGSLERKYGQERIRIVMTMPDQGRSQKTRIAG